MSISERRRQQEEEYSDNGRVTYGGYEETYRDGSLKNECWNSGTGKKSALPEDDTDDQ